MKSLNLVSTVKSVKPAVNPMISALESQLTELRRAETPAAVVASAALIIEQARAIGAEAIGTDLSAKAAVRSWLEMNQGSPVTLSELEAVSGSNEAPRRLRELRADGLTIVGGHVTRTAAEQRALRRAGVAELNKGSYVLLSSRRRRAA